MEKSKNRPQVFINFRGEDERQKLLPHLKHHLKNRNVNVFTDDDAIGEPLDNIFKHIRRSRIVIVLFSINYLESRWCLDELVEITKCLETEKVDFAIPIFYKVKTSHVKKQSGKFGKKFVDLQKKHRNSRVRRWKKALTHVAGLIGLTYQRKSSISELDFIKRIVERVDFTLTKIPLKDKNNNNNDTLETSEGESSDLTVVNRLSTTWEARNLERSYIQGFIVGSAWKDSIISSMPSSIPSFRVSYPANPLHFKCYNWGVDSRPFLSTNVAPFVEVPVPYRLLEPKVPQGYRPSISYHNNINRHHSWPSAACSAQYTTIHPISSHNSIQPMSYNATPEEIMSWGALNFDQSSTKHSIITECCDISDTFDTSDTSDDAEPEDKTSCISFLCHCFKRCFSLKWGAKEDDEE